MTDTPQQSSAHDLRRRLFDAGYVADETLQTALDLVLALRRPLLLEGDAGVGKTAAATALADLLGTRLIRLQCYEGLDANAALYEWNYQRQLLAIKMHEVAATNSNSVEALEAHIFSETYLLRRPLLQAISEPQPAVLLIDEIDRADEAFEAYLLEVLADFQITIPELGTMAATSQPHVILTSNGTRELSDALRRRCLYSWIDYPDADREAEIVRLKLPGIDACLVEQLVAFVQGLRGEDLQKNPGIAETLDWAAALLNYRVVNLSDDLPLLQKTLICLLKTARDLHAVTPQISSRLAGQSG